MKITAISDMHGTLDFNVEKSNILFICGDIFPLRIQRQMFLCEQWLNDTFINWCKNQPVEKIYLIGGNHDLFFQFKGKEKLKELFRYTNITYLEDELTKYVDNKTGKEYSIYGSPWCHKFGNWSFMNYNDKELENKFLQMPDNVDFLLTHDAPYGCSDLLDDKQLELMHRKNPGHIGSIGLANAIKVKKPKFNLHGHLHSTNHNEEDLEGTKVYNVSYVDEFYNPKYKPLIISAEG